MDLLRKYASVKSAKPMFYHFWLHVKPLTGCFFFKLQRNVVPNSEVSYTKGNATLLCTYRAQAISIMTKLCRNAATKQQRLLKFILEINSKRWKTSFGQKSHHQEVMWTCGSVHLIRCRCVRQSVEQILFYDHVISPK